MSKIFFIATVTLLVIGAFIASGQDESGLHAVGFILLIIGCIIAWPIVRIIERKSPGQAYPKQSFVAELRKYLMVTVIGVVAVIVIAYVCALILSN